MADGTRTVAVDVDAYTQQPTNRFSWPWPVTAIVGAIGVALIGWVILAGTATLTWLGDGGASFSAALVLATRVFALAHGVPVAIAGQQVSLIPLGLTLLLVFLSVPVVAFSARRAAATLADADEHGVSADVERVVWNVAGVHAGTYGLVVAILDGAVLGGAAGGRSLLGAGIIGLIAGLWGASNALGHDPTAHWPRWMQVVPRAMAAALLAVLAAGCIVVALAVYFGRARIAELATGIGVDPMGIFALSVLHLLYLPNFVLWACAWLLGAGFTLGDGSLISLHITNVGMLPALPIFGAVPSSGLQSDAMLGWLAVGLVAGLLAGLVVTWARPKARFDETALVGGLAGVASGLALVLLVSLASGSLGSGRLTHIGGRIEQLLVFAPVLLGLAGMVAGLVLGLIRRPNTSGRAVTEDASGETTQPIGDGLVERKEEA